MRGKDFKNHFTRDLRPYFEMLSARRHGMPFVAWQRLVNNTAEAVNRNPDQFLGKDRPGLMTTKSIVDILFEEFIDAESMNG